VHRPLSAVRWRMWNLLSMCSPGVLPAGGYHRRWRQHSYWMRWSRHCGPDTSQVSDKGSLSVSLAYTQRLQRLKDVGLLASTGSTGDSYDNAMAESINGLYKAEVIHRKSWKTGGGLTLHFFVELFSKCSQFVDGVRNKSVYSNGLIIRLLRTP